MIKRYSITLSLLWLVTIYANAQPTGTASGFTDKSFYLIDHLKLDELSENDRYLVDSALTIYHKAEHDTGRLNALGILCENMMHESWHKYQFLHYEIIKKLIGLN